MNLSNVLNTFFGSALIIIVIFAECAAKYSSDRILKKIFCSFLVTTILFLAMDFVFSKFNMIATDLFIKNNNIRIGLNVLPVFFALCIVIYLRKTYRNNSQLFIFLFAFYLISMILNILIVSAKLIWPVMTALLLYAYLFIILKENRTDNLTGLNNRYSFFDFFSRLSRNKTGESWEMAMIDINNFKSINDIYGHLEGDNALRNLAQIIKSCSKKSDFTARYGGDEFVLVTRGAENKINDLITSIEDKLSILNQKNNKLYNIEISYGFDLFVADGNRQIDDFLNHIDKLMRKHNEENRRSGDFRA